jgi:hypothetical protein
MNHQTGYTMSIRTRLSISFGLSLLCAATLAAPAAVADSPQEMAYVGRLARVALDHVLVEAADGTVTSFRVDQVLTQCFDFRGDKTTCETLADVGYADKGRVTVVDGLAKRIDLIVLQQ